tara:strand:- start:208 stop:462 length:255 start_codon:yes stop_codon:yes gene_type:complete
VAELNEIWHTSPMAKSKVDLGKGFKRIYFVISAIWIGGFVIILFQDTPGRADAMHDVIIPALFFIILPIPVYFFIKWIILGFKK